jgi:hypothetical protein
MCAGLMDSRILGTIYGGTDLFILPQGINVRKVFEKLTEIVGIVGADGDADPCE